MQYKQKENKADYAIGGDGGLLQRKIDVTIRNKIKRCFSKIGVCLIPAIHISYFLKINFFIFAYTFSWQKWQSHKFFVKSEEPLNHKMCWFEPHPPLMGDWDFWKIIEGDWAFQVALRGWGQLNSPKWGGWEILLRNFFIQWWEPEKWFWPFEPFSQLNIL